MPRPPAQSRIGWIPKLLLVVLAPLLFLSALELSLRLGDYGRDPHFFIPDDSPGAPADAFRSNPRFTESVFPASFGLKAVNLRLTRTKPTGTKRVFLLGGSAAMGVPEAGFGLAPQLEAALSTMLPGEPIEVHNLGITAINSHVVLPILREVLAFEPDLLVIYLGNNEVVGPYGPGSAITAATPPLPLIRASQRLRATRTGQLLESLIGQVKGAAASDQRSWRGMEMFAREEVPADDPRLATVYANFTANLHDMLELAAAAEVPVVVSTVAVNLSDCAPFVSRPAPDGLDADTHFHRGRERLAAGDTAAATTHFRTALQYDALRFRADDRINQIIRDTTAAAPGAYLADSATALGLGGRRHFFEHVHLTFTGNHAITRELATVAAPLLAPHATIGRFPSIADLAAAIGFTPVGHLSQWQVMNDLVTRPPFTGQSTYAEDRTFARAEINRLNHLLTPDALSRASGTIEAARLADPGSAFLAFHAAKLAVQLGDRARALRLLDAHDAIVPANAESRVLRAFLLAETGAPRAAVDLFLAVIEAEPYYPQTYPLLASLWSALGDFDTGRTAFATWVEAMPNNRGVRLAYAQLLDAAGDRSAAVTQWQAVLAIVPDDERALQPLLQYHLAAERYDDAVDLMLAAHAYNPRNFTNNDRLVQVYQSRGDTTATLRYMRDLMASGPVSTELRRDYERLSAAANAASSR
ncbi:hypothetical protein [Actomonas aquatica]|uniref:SGNH hydrolase-type esterase domain-containing protein n=1 Tax=Actomonas aquatica TaxID=2866162 RepID=A0ABZ1CDW1_9BACT|nr:hypothetical protein [Opitutus sp. WL0086]WRQ88824.1 hypothetical protein K1X11_005365 [Opitutus sp. WL0086]